MRTLRFAAVAVCLGACSPALATHPVPTSSEVPRLEARLVGDSADADALVPLAAAYREAGRFEPARALLERALRERPADPGTLLLLGLTYEDLNRFADAADAYGAYLRVGRAPRMVAQVRGRLQLVRRQAWIGEARDALALEARDGAPPAEPRTVAVYPFAYLGAAEELRPLGPALAEMLATDLARTERLRVLERARLQALMEEARLGEEGLVDPATGVRGGRLLGAERIIQGRIDGTDVVLDLEAATIEVRAEPRVEPVADRDEVDRLWELQARLALELHRVLGIELTPAERARIERRPTRHLQALLAFGTGLEAGDAGRYAEAAQFFAHAAALDPGFAVAEDYAAAAAQAAAAAATSTAELTAAALQEWGADDAAFAAVERLVPGAGGRDAASEALGQESIGSRGAVLRIIVRPRPGGGS